MLPGGFLGGWTFRDATVNLVETERQKTQLTAAFGAGTPRLGVFAQRLPDETFAPRTVAARSAARLVRGVSDSTTHLLYAGRWIANKGLVQVARALNIWPLADARFTIVGDFEDDFLISQSDGVHLNFRDFFRREVLACSPALQIELVPTTSQRQLHEWYTSADAFICPSFHEDEASGNAAHEAVLSGVPAIVTDWCGLGQLGRNTRGGAVATYSTLGGVRFSLAGLRASIDLAERFRARFDESTARADAEWVRDTFDPSRMRASIRSAVDLLAGLPAEPPPMGGWRCAERVQRIASIAPEGFKRAILEAGTPPPSGLFVDGGGCGGDPTVSLPHLLQAIQSMYTTWPTPPTVRRGMLLRGFWRVSLWPDERALVEFGFPGPRLLRFVEADWVAVLACATALARGEFEFRPTSDAASRALQRAVDLGYLVPDVLGADSFDRGAAIVE